MEAKLYKKLDNKKVECFLCPHNCTINNGKHGICRIRKNEQGTLIAESYQLYSSIAYDPVEKKPLYHYYPGKEVLSLGSVGCNMRCQWCQNCDISQTGIESYRSLKRMLPGEIIELANQNRNNIGIAYTYNEPSISFETISEVAPLAKSQGLKNIMVSNGYMSTESLGQYLNYIDAFNIDIKSFEDKVYWKFTNAHLKPVLDNLINIKKANAYIELTYLVIPEINDNKTKFSEFIDWVCSNLGKDIVLHISRYFPWYKTSVQPTPVEKLKQFAETAASKLNYVYVGNIDMPEFKNTKCSKCKCEVIFRNRYNIRIDNRIKDGNCPVCGNNIYIGD